MSANLDWLPQTAFVMVLIFARVGTMMMLMPALGDAIIPARIKLSFALLLSLAMFPLISQKIPAMPPGLAAMLILLGHEMAVGFIVGGLARMIIAAAQTAGAVIAFQIGLSFAQTADPSQNGLQGVIIGNFLSLLGITLIFVTDLHYMVIRAIYDSYAIFPTDAPLMLGDAATSAIAIFSSTFVVGVQMASPFIVFGLVFFLGLGLLGRLMPQLQVFFVAQPANVGIGLMLFAVLLVSIIGLYLNHFENQFAKFLG